MKVRALSLTAFLGLLIASVATTTLRSHESPAPLCTIAWSPPRPVMMGDAYIHIGAPAIVGTRAGVALLGDNALALGPSDSGYRPIAGWTRPTNRIIAGFLMQSNGTVVPIPPPPGVRSFLGAQAVSNGQVAHVFWASSEDTSADAFRHVAALHFARFDGSRWTSPESLLADTNLLWEHQLTGVVMSRGSSHVMALSAPGPGPHVVHISRDAEGHGWVKQLEFRALYADLAADVAGTLWLATIDATSADRAIVFVRRSADGGQTWNDPVVVYRSGSGTAHDPRLVVTADGTLFLGWIVGPPGYMAGLADRMDFARSTDRGATWHALPPIRGTHVRDLLALADGRQAFQITYVDGDSGGTIMSARFDGKMWSALARMSVTWFAAGLAAPQPDSLYAMWHEWRELDSARVPTAVLTRRRSCLE